MNEEEKNAVEFVKKRTKELKKYAKRENELVYDDIILNLIEKLQKENEELKGQYAEYVKLTCNEVAKNSELNSESNSAIKEKNKIINAMSKYIAKLDIDEDICKYINCGEGDKEREKCVECITKYFKKKMRQKCDTATTEK